MSIFRTLFAPLNYLRARNSHKLVWDWVVPLVGAALGVTVLLIMPKPVAIISERGLVHGVNELLQVLVGFYIAALAAIASFDRASLDQQIENEGVTLEVIRDGEKVTKSLTRRAFLSLMFGYLALLSIVLYCTGVGANILADNIRLIPSGVLLYLKPAFVFVYLALCIQMISITMVSLFYLSDRIHRQSPTPLPPQDVKDSVE